MIQDSTLAAPPLVPSPAPVAALAAPASAPAVSWGNSAAASHLVQQKQSKKRALKGRCPATTPKHRRRSKIKQKWKDGYGYHSAQTPSSKTRRVREKGQ